MNTGKVKLNFARNSLFLNYIWKSIVCNSSAINNSSQKKKLIGSHRSGLK